MSLLPRIVILVLIATVGRPCAEAADPASAHEREVRAFLKIFSQAFKDRDEAAIRKLYVSDDRLSWYEDGRLKYDSVETVLKALKSMPSTMGFETSYTDTTIEMLSGRIATMHTKFDSKIISNGKPVFGWSGVTTMVLEKDDTHWKALSGHSSTPKPRPAQKTK